MGFNMLKITILALALAAVSSAKTLERGKFLSSETILYFFENSLVLQVLWSEKNEDASEANKYDYFYQFTQWFENHFKSLAFI